ncbi:hypothetical protein [Caldimonas brevitalea]|uniref:Uncharacterized protein n=1 Tax=Caldimonas brevitalea TaxID=413882 RepID=A0A0G3BFK7_9BURK|nr:hypothetical protein [Caldimonas brevitalea]AKJ28229.1 hypothetical protein AAW51_1538 [Caldimonas brevitalea]
MMSFEQAVAYIGATGASAYCHVPWLDGDGKWIGVQRCVLCEAGPGDAAEGLGLMLRVRRLPLCSGQWDTARLQVDSTLASLSPGMMMELYGMDLLQFRYAGCDPVGDVTGTVPGACAGARWPASASSRQWCAGMSEAHALHLCEPHFNGSEWPYAPPSPAAQAAWEASHRPSVERSSASHHIAAS